MKDDYCCNGIIGVLTVSNFRALDLVNRQRELQAELSMILSLVIVGLYNLRRKIILHPSIHPESVSL